ncbi:helix-hairpin-helix domain-containing protein [Halobaculum limi]|uniref:helix-hairpin-helix domain-containing protein n=1 Tax=Halobaculum limi TaxID=3031916 RepID=UPI002405B50D|nr:helix-hairpin-helix domain-containing protein [Halobaculum sp. YSMS11]
MTATDPVFGIALLLVFACIAVYDKLQKWRDPDLTPTERAEHRYATGEIDINELERRLDVLEDPEAVHIRSAVERVSGIGEDISWDIAARFNTLDDVREASVEELTSVPGVGEKRAVSLRESL